MNALQLRIDEAAECGRLSGMIPGKLGYGTGEEYLRQQKSFVWPDCYPNRQHIFSFFKYLQMVCGRPWLQDCG